MKDAEKKFWLDVAGQLNPHWQVSGEHSADLLASAMSTHDTFVYMVDSATMWMAAGSTLASELMRAKRQLGAAKLEPGAVTGAAGAAILECSALKLDARQPQVHEAFTATVCAITDSGTWTAVMDRIGNPAGHWIWLVYTLADGQTLGRPVYGQDDRRGFLPMDKLYESVGAALANDIGNQASSVSRQIRAGGGARICEDLVQRFPATFGRAAKG